MDDGRKNANARSVGHSTKKHPLQVPGGTVEVDTERNNADGKGQRTGGAKR